MYIFNDMMREIHFVIKSKMKIIIRVEILIVTNEETVDVVVMKYKWMHED